VLARAVYRYSSMLSQRRIAEAVIARCGKSLAVVQH